MRSELRLAGFAALLAILGVRNANGDGCGERTLPVPPTTKSSGMQACYGGEPEQMWYCVTARTYTPGHKVCTAATPSEKCESDPLVVITPVRFPVTCGPLPGECPSGVGANQTPFNSKRDGSCPLGGGGD